MDFAGRLQVAFNRTRIKPGRSRITEVATQFGVSRETSRLWFAGAAMPELQRLIEIADFCNVNLDWLATGRPARGDTMTVRDDPLSAYGLSADERSVLEAMRSLAPHKRQGLVALLSP